MREKDTVLDVLPELPTSVALELLRHAASDASSMVHRRAAELAFAVYIRTMHGAFRNLILGLRNDADVVVRSRVEELFVQLPAAALGSSAEEEASLPPKPLPAAAPQSEPAAPSPREAPAPTKAPGVVPATRPRPVRGTPPAKAPVKTTPAATAAPPKEDPRAKTMGLIQIYVPQNGRCQLVKQYYLPPGDHIVNVDGGSSQTISVYAGMTISVKQCP